MNFDHRFTGKSQPKQRQRLGLIEQASEAGWAAGMFEFPPCIDTQVYFNPAVRRLKNGERQLYARESQWYSHWSGSDNRIVRFDISGNRCINPKVISGQRVHPQEQWEDPRILQVGSKTFLSLAVWFPNQKPILVNQRIVELGKNDEVIQQWSPVYGNNGRNALWNTGNEKNWGWFEYDGELHFVYNVYPHTVVRTHNDSVDSIYDTTYAHGWTLGQLRGGTNPIRVGNEFIAFFHSSVPWKSIPKYGERRRYFMGAYAFEAKPPFKVTRITAQPLLTGTDLGPVIPGSPAVVFPCGSLFEGDKFFITYGVNDCASGWVEIPLSQLMDRMKEVK